MTRALTKKFNAISKWRTEVAFALMWWLSRGKALLFNAVKMSTTLSFKKELKLKESSRRFPFTKSPFLIL